MVELSGTYCPSIEIAIEGGGDSWGRVINRRSPSPLVYAWSSPWLDTCHRLVKIEENFYVVFTDISTTGEDSKNTCGNSDSSRSNTNLIRDFRDASDWALSAWKFLFADRVFWSRDIKGKMAFLWMNVEMKFYTLFFYLQFGLKRWKHSASTILDLRNSNTVTPFSIVSASVSI